MRRLPTLALAALLIAGCDVTRTDEPGTLVVEAYVETDAPLPPVRVSRTRAVADPRPAPEPLASVELFLNGQSVPYAEADEPGTYRPVPPFDTLRARAGDAFRLEVRSGTDVARGDGTVPPGLRDVFVALDVPADPVEAILLDSLRLPLDSLQFELPSRTGYVYPIVAALTWPDAEPDWWVSLTVEPREPFSSTLLDYFLRPRSVSEEAALRDAAGGGSWTGVYAIPVDDAGAPVPVHDVVVTVVRGDADWAAWAASAGDPSRREPLSNVRGGVGLVVGVSVARRTIRVP